MTGRKEGRFTPEELAGVEADASEMAGATALARELEMLAAESSANPSAGFAARVSAAIAAEPMPAPAVAARDAIEHRNPGGFFAALRDARRVAFGAGRPLVMRGQAFALLLIVLLGALSATGVAAAGAIQIFAPAPAHTQHATPTASPSPSLSGTPLPGATHRPGESAGPTEPGRSNDGGGSSGGPGDSAKPTDTLKPGETPRPTDTLKPGETPKASETPKVDETADNGHGQH
jgi:hypothetical protein